MAFPPQPLLQKHHIPLTIHLRRQQSRTPLIGSRAPRLVITTHQLPQFMLVAMVEFLLLRLPQRLSQQCTSHPHRYRLLAAVIPNTPATTIHPCLCIVATSRVALLFMVIVARLRQLHQKAILHLQALHQHSHPVVLRADYILHLLRYSTHITPLQGNMIRQHHLLQALRAFRQQKLLPLTRHLNHMIPRLDYQVIAPGSYPPQVSPTHMLHRSHPNRQSLSH